jgi:ATP-binding cassette subfamily B protein/subfamily B ATP-binding cassette protein MsbA
MQDFIRVLRIAMRQRLAVAGVIISSLVIAAFWGINIGAIYPLVEVVFRGDSLPEYVDQQIAKSREQIGVHDRKIEEYKAKLATANETDRTKLLSRLRIEELGRDAMFKSEILFGRLRPWMDGLPTEPYPTLLFLMGLLLIGTILKLTAAMINLVLVQMVTERTTMRVRAFFYRRALHLDLDEFGDSGSAELTSRITNDVSQLNGGINTLLGKIIREPLKLIVCFAGAAFICWRLLLLIMVVAPLLAFISQRLSKLIRKASRRVMSEMSQMFGMLNDSFAGIRLVKIYNTQAAERAKFQTGLEAYYQRSMRMAFYTTLARNTSEFLGTVIVCLGIVAGGYLVINQKTHLLGIRMCLHPLEVGQILLFFGFLIGASDPARKLSEVWSDLQRGIAASERVYEVIDRPVRVRNPKEAVTLRRPHQLISFEDVEFSYPSGPQVLQGINLTIRHGETIALVGPNGCGKSTLVSLLCRFDDPQRGEVKLDGVPLNQMRFRDIRKRIGLVSQRTTMFEDTIANNIAYGCHSASRERIIRAAKLAYADDFIRNKTPDGYETLLGNARTRLSGGQMQRLALARAILRDPDILILDEATSQIDTESEHLINQALASFLKGRTGILITHRPSSLMLADRVIVMQDGQIAAEGKHEELLATDRFYQSLCRSAEANQAA